MPVSWLPEFHNVIACIYVSPLVSCVHQVDEFLQALVSYDKEHIPESCLTVVKQEYLRKPEFHPDLVRTKSTAAAGLCAWTINIVRYYEVRQSPQIPCSFDNITYYVSHKLLKWETKFQFTGKKNNTADEGACTGLLWCTFSAQLQHLAVKFCM